jgi:4-amino-4-deoxy-L-arabinose transferase-like glycosyltransferase
MNSLIGRITKIERLLEIVAILIAVGMVLVHFASFLFIVFSRITFPFTLEWMEGGSFIQVSRILSGQPLYVRPSFDFIPQIYPPVYYYVSALASKIFGNGFVPLRLISILSTVGILFLVFILAYKQSGNKLGGILASGLFCATYGLSGFWFDIARVDSLALGLLLLSIYLFLNEDIKTSALGGLVFALSCFTKQTMLIAGGIFLVYALLPPRKTHLIFIGTAALGFLGGTMILNWFHEGWYSYYIFQLPGRHRVIPNIIKLFASINEILFIEIIRPVFIATIIGLIYLFVFPGKTDVKTNKISLNRMEVRQVWSQRAIWLLIIAAGLLAIVSVGFLASLPSDTERAVLGPFSLSRLVLMLGPIGIAALVIFLAIRMRKDDSLTALLAKKLFAQVSTVPRILLGYVILLLFLIITIANFRPEMLGNLTMAHIQRLLPYLAGPFIILVMLGIIWRFLWSSTNNETWFFFLLAAGLIAISWIGRLNPGGYYNVFMPAHAGISILFGLGISTLLQQRAEDISVSRKIIRILVLVFSSVQLISLFTPPAAQIPTQADEKAGMELVEQIRMCPGDVYIPFHNYLIELAGKGSYAGVVEMGELRGSFGGRTDPLWDEVLSQIQLALDTQTFTVVIQDNQVFRDATSPNYVESGQIFENELVFWPMTGRKIRPEIVYYPINGEICVIEIK